MDEHYARMTAEKIQELADRRKAENEENRDKAQPVTTVRIDFDVSINALIASAPSDPASACRLLEIIEQQLRQNATLHPMLVAYLCDALKAAVAQPLDLQARELTDGLHLTSKRRRPAQDWLPPGKALADHLADGMSKNKAKAAVAADFGIDETTALKYYDQYREAKEAHESILEIPANRDA